ncbi:hypothetical protein [Gracilimonas mengyeensis]|uniref:ATP synthase I chain n=1 Tax=Gracilimonas mengyeensis TaxID=1302730 RepID=A0A521AB93_9BACT|nr:hypothetical protein [Gracilimonas mengyeensis]SMO32058.1 hypothetical protein SAMN06265219_10121 [Gracilimonas mengyeensis]
MTNDTFPVMKRTLKMSVLLLVLSTTFFLIGEQQGVAVVSGVLLSCIFVVSSAWVFDFFSGLDNKKFMKIFFLSTALRFVLVLILFGIFIGLTKIDEIYFTVSFIISYLCQSVTEVIFINKILDNSGR